MLLIEKKIIEELSFDNENQAGVKGVVLYQDDLLYNSKEVEVVDIPESYADWHEDMSTPDNYTEYLIKSGYKLIKIK